MKSIEIVKDAVHAGARTIFGLGMVLVMLGVTSLLVPWASGLAVQVVVGFVMIGAGITWIVFSFHAKSWGSGLWEAIVGVLAIITGVVGMANPLVSLAIMTLALLAFFMAAGVLKIVFAFQMKPLPGWGWILFNGFLSILLSVLITFQWPFSGTWAVGTFVGIDLLMGGFSLIRTSFTSERVSKESANHDAAVPTMG